LIDFETLQTLFLGLLAIVGTISTILVTFVLKKLGCFDTDIKNHGERISSLETVRAIYHPKCAI